MRRFVATWSALLSSGFQARGERRRALRELDILQQQEEWVLKLDEGNLVNRARVALDRGDSAGALRFLREAMERYPRFAKMSHDSLEVMIGLQLFDEAELLALEGERNVPRDPFYANSYALVAERRGDTEEAIRRWERVRKKFPRSWMGYVHGATCMGLAGQYEAANALIERAIKLFPGMGEAWVTSAQIAEYRGDWPEAIRRWRMVRDKFKHPTSDIGIARGLEELGRIEDAEAQLIEAQLRWPLAPEIASALARLAKLRGDDEETVKRWADARRRFPLLPFGYREGFRHVLGIGRYEDADAILLAAVDRFPTEAWPVVEYASLAHTRHDWEAAAARWSAVRAAWPDRQDGYLRGAEACAALGRQDEAAELRAEHQRRFPR